MVLVVTLFALGYNDNPIARWSSGLVGAATTLLSAMKGVSRDRLPCEFWVIGLLSILVVGYPCIVGFSMVQSAQWTSTLLGIVFRVDGVLTGMSTLQAIAM